MRGRSATWEDMAATVVAAGAPGDYLGGHRRTDGRLRRAVDGYARATYDERGPVLTILLIIIVLLLLFGGFGYSRRGRRI
jgi:hypothetical protein